ncbi:probable cytochrome P450 6a13 isoform X2 [Daktulosphaira vitifoliae]|uniref:probable cytochrome P450 6a13 isoform X2 n=1 Tax=Daktulosphaira vitifoliae TaxID=58002 RepID=UPI0021AA0A43|nr:probable cytochrome P450 6a13 isoform X2 [Daktulosphaira vitifoliae]
MILNYSSVWLLYTNTIMFFLVVLFYYFCNSTFNYWRKRNVPFAKPVTLFGSYFDLMRGRENTTHLFLRLYEECIGQKYYGMFQMRTPTLLVRSPELITRVLINDFQHFTDRGFSVDINATPLANNLFSMKGKQWKVMRHKITPIFTSSKLQAMQEQIKECSNVLMEKLASHLNNSDTLDIWNIMGNYSTDVIGTTIFGINLNVLNDEESYFRKFGKAVFAPSLRIAIKDMCTFISPTLRKMLCISDWPVEAMKFFQCAFYEILDYREKNNIIRNDLIGILLNARKDLIVNKLEPTVNFKETDIIAQAFVMFVAGFETVSNTMCFCLYELALNKDIQDRLRDNISNAKLMDSTNDKKEYLHSLKYLDMVLSETLRKYPPLPIIIREVSVPYQLPNENLVLPKGMKIIVPAYSIHMDPVYYPNPMKFDPERFSPEENNKRQSGIYLPFGEGQRVCLGKRFAELEMKLALSELLSKYEVLPCEKTLIPMTFQKRTINIVAKNNTLWLKFKPICT